ncbi:PREDICTED: dynein assembly factor 1, axonemal-like [Ceratosolen solmsi marchali]|uniref:Dynein axonemal assembly factor 1 homolog n=1 Tax=Ceratosolen solmsi marchali TaxID=326594 RepID=A0AAJ6YSB0_9HYME|nr:PREDICTED: dynein assembly factor 1, axonemal-like [Ceratosolen solmsi marchali]
MTECLIKKYCRDNKLYETPYLNDVLYLHYKGFSFIENLDNYTGLKCLWLENNGIKEIANLNNQTKLKCLFLHNNLIKKIENLEYLEQLDNLNLAYNLINKIENLDSLNYLTNLNLSHNYLKTLKDIEHIRYLDSVSILDISYNKIDTVEVVNVVGAMKSLRVLTLKGNPVIKFIKMYRKSLILNCKYLQHLDDKPVFPCDRACAEAWSRGGLQEEQVERRLWIECDKKKINDSVICKLF